MKTKVEKFRFIVKIARNVACLSAFFALSASADDPRTLGYATSGAAAALPAAPDMGGTVVNVTAAQAQYVLDGAYGSIDGKTINFTESVADTLVLGRASKYEGSGTLYRHGSHDGEAMSYADFIAYKNQATWTEGCYYERTVENVAFTADKDVVVNFTAEGGAHVYGTESAPVYDYVRDTGTWIRDTNNSFYKRAILKNISFQGLTFKAKTNFNTSESTTVFDGFAFTGCTFETGSSTAADNQALRYYNENNNGNVRNLVVENCTFRNCFQGIYTHHVKGITVKDCTFETPGHNAIAIQSTDGKGACDHGAVVITGNTFKNIGDRVIRFNEVGAGTTITIADNTADGNSGKLLTGKREIVAATSLPENAAEIITASNNDWGANAVVEGVFADAEPVAATIGTVSYETLDAALSAVQDGETIVVNAGEYKLMGSQSAYSGKAFTVKAAENAAVSFDMSAAVTLGGAKITFEGVTFDYKTNGDYIGLQHADTLVYNDCTIKGKVFLYAASETFNRCTFNQSAVDYNVWTYGAKKVAFNACTFNCAGKSVLIYNEGTNEKTDLTVASCEFKASAEATGKAAIEIDTSRMTGGASVAIDGETTATGFATGSNSGSTLWNDKKQTKDTNKSVTVTVAGETVFAPVVAKIGETGYASLAEAIAAAKASKTVTLIADTRENVIIDKRLTLDLNGFTLNGGTVKGKAALTVNAVRVTIKDSSEAQTGTIKREDTAANSGETSYYVLDVQGKNGFVSFEGGTVINDSGTTDGTRKGASLVRIGDDNVSDAYPQLTIKGGTFTQNNFVAIKVDRGTFFLTGGTINCPNDEAVKNWGTATIKGGTVNGTVASWVYAESASSSALTISDGATVNGNVYAMSYDGTEGKTATVSITGGRVTGELGTYQGKNIHDKAVLSDVEKASIGVTGGTFTKDPSAYLVEGSTAVRGEDGTFSVQRAPLAQIGDTYYYTMDDAFHAANASEKVETIVLLRDYTTPKLQNSGSKGFTLDLNGKTWTCTGSDANSAAFEINYPNVTLTVKNGKVVSDQLLGLIPSAMGGTITYDNAALVFENVEATVNGRSGIETNGNNTNDAITLKGCTLTVANGYGIYFSSSGTLTIEDSVIVAKTMGVQVCAGSLNITGVSKITVTGDAVSKVGNDGAIEDGAAVSVVNRMGYKALEKIVLSGGTFTAKAGNAALKAYAWANGTESAFDNAMGTIAISGGTFSTAVSPEYCAEGFIPTANSDGTFGVKEGAYVAAIGEVKYETLAEAIAAAKAGDAVTLLADVNNADYTVANALNISLASGVTLDGNGKTLSGNVKVTVASAGGVTIKNVLFKDIHNAAVVSADAKEKYGFGDAKVGTLSAVYAPKLAGSLTVTGCTFENCDWEALQITPAEGAKIDIRENVFKTSASDLVVDQLRHLHIEMAYGTGFDYEGTDIEIAVTDNQFLGGAKDAAAGIWWVGKASVLALSGNYYAEPDTVSITLSDGKNRTNRCDLIYPARSQADVDVDDLMAVALILHDVFNASSYSTLAEAIAAVKDGETVTLLADATEDIVVATSVTLDLGGKTLTNAGAGKVTLTIAKGATVTVKNGSIVGGASNYAIQNNGTATFEDVMATAGNVGSSMLDNFGTLTINSGTYVGGMNTVKNEPKATLTVNGGTFENSYGEFSNHTAVIYNAGSVEILGGELTNKATSPAWAYPHVVMTVWDEVNKPSTVVKGGKLTCDWTDWKASILNHAGGGTAGCTTVSGGTFNKKVPEDYCAAGFIPTANDDGTFGVKEGAYVAAIGEVKYETVDAAMEAAAASETATTVKLLAESADETVVPTWWVKSDVTIDADDAVTATFAPIENATDAPDTDGMAYLASDDAETARTITVGEKVTLAFPDTAEKKGAFYVGYGKDKNWAPTHLVLNGRIEAYLPYIGAGSSLTVSKTGSLKSLSEDLITRRGSTVTVTGTDGAWSAANPQVALGYSSQQGGEVTFKDTFVTGGAYWTMWNRNGNADVATKLTLDNTTFTAGAFNGSAKSAGETSAYQVELKNGSKMTVAGDFAVIAEGAVTIEAGSLLTAKSISNAGTLTVRADALTDAVKVVDYTGADELTLADYGTVKAEGGELYVEDNDLWIRPPAVAAIGAARYASLADALAAAKEGDTVTLLADIVVEGPNGTSYNVTAGVTLDLNGHSVDGSNVGLNYANPAALGLNVEEEGVLALVNTAATAARISGYVPLLVASSYGDPLKVEIGDGIELAATAGGTGNGVQLDSSVYLAYGDKTAALFKNGGFKAVVGGEARIYTNFDSASDKADDTTAVLLNDYTGDQPIKVMKYGKGHTAFTLDLDGHSYTYTGGNTYGIVNLNCAKALTVKNGTLADNVPSADRREAGVKLEATGAKVTLENVVVETTGTYGVATSGSNKENDVTLVGTTIRAANGVGVYFPSTGTLTIDGGAITGLTGVQVCAGRLLITGEPTITATGAGQAGIPSSGAVLDGAAVSVVIRTGYGAFEGVAISGGQFTSAAGVEALQAYAVDGTEKTAWAEAAEKVAISGGTFSTAVPPDYCAAGFIPTANDDGTFGVKEGAYVAAIGEEKYETLQAAFDAAKKGDTVTLLSDITLTEQVNITKALDGLTLDGNNKTITCATTTDPFQSGGSALYFGNANDKLYCTGIAIKDLTMTGTARFAIFLFGGTSTTFTNVKISGHYYIAVNLYGTHGATMTDCEISNSTTGTDKYISAIWSNVASVNPLTLNNTTVNVIAINAYTTANELKPKIYVNAGSTVDEIHTYDDGSVSGDTRLCVGESPVMPSVKIYDETSKTWIDAPAVVVVKALIGEGRVTLPDALLARVPGTTRVEQFANLSKADANGNLAWVNLVAGIDSAKTVTMTVPQNNEPDVIDVDLPTVGEAPEGTDVTVRYEIRADGSEAAVVSAEDVEDLVINLNGKASIGTYRAYVCLLQNGTEVARVVSENALGVLQTVRAAKKTIIAVPWLSLTDGNAIAVADLVKTAGLTAGDKLHVYNKAENRYDVYELTADKAWAPKAIYKVGADGTVETASSGTPETTTVARGSGVWIERQDTTQPIVSYGAVASATVATTIDAGTAEKKAWNLLAVPTTTAINLAATFGTSETDEIIVPTDGAPKVCTVKDGAWGYDKTVSVTDKFGNPCVQVVREAVTELPAGTGFWYLNGGAAKTVNW